MTTLLPNLTRLAAAALVVAAGAGVFVGGCDSNAGHKPSVHHSHHDDAPVAHKPKPPEEVHGPMLPDRGGAFRPSLARLADKKVHMASLTEVDKCAQCHPKEVAQWRDSVHHFASLNNPLYRVALDKFVDASGQEKARFCNGCHDPVLMFDKGLSDRFAPDRREAHLGITCGVCHGVKDARYDGNASYTLTTAKIPIPDFDDPQSIATHVQRVTTTKVDENALCVSCHRAFLSKATGHAVHLQGIDAYAPWRRSRFNDNPVTRLDEGVKAQTCVNCHMPEGPDGHSSHRFAGGHSALAKMIGSKKQLEAVRKMVESAATLDIAAVGVGSQDKPTRPDAFELHGGEKVWFDVVVRNTGVGHRFPSGVPDLKDTWLEVVLSDTSGRTLVQSGVAEATTGDDPTAHRFRVLLLDKMAGMQPTHSVAHFRAAGYDHTIAPRDAAVVRYVWHVPQKLETVKFPVQVRVRLRHRRMNLATHKQDCEAFETKRGQALFAASKKYLGRGANPCVKQPIIDMKVAKATLRPDGYTLPKKPAWQRWYERGLALQKQLSERLPEAHDSFERALAALDKDTTMYKQQRDLRRAIVLVGQAQVYARQANLDKAIATFDAAEKLVGKKAAIYYGRAAAYARVWRFKKAVHELEQASKLVDDDRIWRKLAQQQGSLSRPIASLMSARRGLKFEPRDDALLRSQLVALRALDVPKEWVDEAKQAFDDFKNDEKAHLIQEKCSDDSAVCRRERLQVHSHMLVAPGESMEATRPPE